MEGASGPVPPPPPQATMATRPTALHHLPRMLPAVRSLGRPARALRPLRRRSGAPCGAGWRVAAVLITGSQHRRPADGARTVAVRGFRQLHRDPAARQRAAAVPVVLLPGARDVDGRVPVIRGCG